jgi:predicted DNA-binding transcriptional regulator AlpA
MTLLTVNQLAVRWHVNEQSVYKAIRGERDMRVPVPVRLGRRVRFREEDVLAIEGRTNAPSTAPECLPVSASEQRRGRPRKVAGGML